MKRTIIDWGWCWRTTLVGVQHGTGSRMEGDGYWFCLYPLPFIYIELWIVKPWDDDGKAEGKEA